jgi:polyisoprenoid-binding protein YceI
MQANKEIASNDKRGVWRFDPTHTLVEFSVRNLFFTVKGRLSTLEGSILLDEDDITRSSVIAAIRANSIETGIGRRDAHLRSSDFLDASNHPLIHFQSSSVGPGKDRDLLSVKGMLSIKGKSGEVELEVSEVDRSRSPRGEQVIYYCATTELDRSRFGITYGWGVIGRRLKVVINVQASREE